jgi:hypothetical protein
MKLLALVLTYILCLNAFAAAPLGFTGQAQTQNKYPSVVKAPNSLLTDLGSGQVLIENGNNNILSNPSFEHSTVTTGWTSSTVTPAASTTTVIHGKKALCFTASSQAFTLSQDSTLYASQFADGVQGLASIRLKTNHTGAITVCSNNAGTASTSNCVTAQASNTWGLYKIPFILGATSSGITVSAASGSGTTCVDDAFVGAVDLKQDINIVTPWQSYTPTFTGFGTATNIEFQWRQVGENVEIKGKFTSGTSTATETRISLPNNYTSAGTSKIPSIQLAGLAVVGAQSATVFHASTLIEPSVGYITLGYQTSTTNALTKANGNFIIGSGQSMTVQATVPVSQLSGATSVYTAQNANTSLASCGLTASDFTGFGTPTSINLNCAREGQFLVVQGRFTSGTSTATEGRINLKLAGVALATASSSIVDTLIRVGSWTQNTALVGNGHVLIQPSKTYMVFGYETNAAAGLLTTNANGIIASGTVMSIDARIPIEGWQNSNVMIGQFSEVMTTPGVGKPKTVYYNFGGASATLASPTVCAASPCIEVSDPLNVFTPPTRLSAGNYLGLTIANGTFAANSPIKCDCNGYATTNGVRDCYLLFNTGQNTWMTNANGGYVTDLFTGIVTGTGTDAYVSVSCEGQAP